MTIAYELSHAFDDKTGTGHFELIAVETDEQGRFVSLGGLSQFHYTHLNDYQVVRRQAERDTLAHFERIRLLRRQRRQTTVVDPTSEKGMHCE